jgi:PAS domain S-box-containing protein
MMSWREGRLARTANVCAALGVALGAVVLVGWYAGVVHLIRLGPGSGVIAYNTAVCLASTAGALAALTRRHNRMALGFGLVALFLAVVTGLEYAWDWSAGIDQLLWHLGVNEATMRDFAGGVDPEAGRMGRNTAFVYTLLSSSLMVVARRRVTMPQFIASVIICLTGIALGAVGFFGYVVGIPTSLLWGHSTPMVLQIAPGGTFIGVGALCAIVLSARRAGLETRRVIPAIAATTVAIMALVMWEALLNHDRRNLALAVRHQSTAIASQVARAVDDRARVVDRMSQRTSVAHGARDGAGSLSAVEILRDFSGLTSVTWFDVDGAVVWRDAGSASLGQQSVEALLRESTRHARAIVSEPVVVRGMTPRVFIAAPTARRTQLPDGYVLVELNPRDLLIELIADEIAGRYNYRLTDGRTELASAGESTGFATDLWTVTTPINVRGRRWELSISPRWQTVVEFSTGLPLAFLLAALACAIFTGWIVRAAQVAGEQSTTLSHTVAKLDAENVARQQLEASRDVQAQLLHTQSEELEKQNVALQATANELAEQRDALAREQEFAAALVRSTVDGVVAFDRRGHVHAWNPAIASLTGRPLAEVEGTTIGTLLPFLEAGQERQLLQEALLGRATELNAVRASHQLWQDEVWLDLTVTPMRATDGKVVGGLLVARDVTERQRVAEVILASKEAAEQANRTKSDFLARMSHELRTPLNAVIGFTNVMLRNRNNHLEREEINYLQRIGANGRHLLSLINEVLDLTKIEAGHESVVMASTHVARLVRDTVANLEVRATDAGVRLEVIAGSTGEALTDESKLKQVLINLVGNAIKFTPSGGEVTVRVVTNEASGEAERIEVQDSGIGIPRDRLDAIFEAFEQADEQTSRKYGGTGLGLAISQKLCDLMGHDLVVTSEPGSGSTFTVLLAVRRAVFAA